MSGKILTVGQHLGERVALKESDDYKRRDEAWVRLREHDLALRELVRDLVDEIDALCGNRFKTAEQELLLARAAESF